MPESEFSAFLEFEALRAKHDYMQQFGVDSNADIARTLAMFGGFTEGLQLFASFAMLMNFPRFNKMKGMGQISRGRCATRACTARGWSSSTTPSTPRPGCDQGRGGRHHRLLQDGRDLEDRFIDLAFEAGEVQGMTPADIKAYIRFIADWRLRQLACPPSMG